MINSTLNLALIATVTTSAIPAGKQKENAQKQPNPNVLFIAVDDLKPILGCYNDQLIKTPHIDRLAAMGTVFKNAYCQQAISGATRSSLLTGFRPDRTQVYDLVTQIRDMNPDVTTLPEHFKKEGYTTSAIGKIFHPSNVVNEDGERSWSIPHSEGESYYAKEYGLPALGHWQAPDTKKEINKCIAEAKEKGIKENLSKYVFQYIKPSVECIDVPDNAYADGALTMEAQERLKSLTKTGKPFFLAVGYHKPHLPFVAPKKYWDLYDREQLPLAEFQEQAQGSLSVAYHNCGELKNYTDIPACCKFTERDTPRIGLSVEKQKELIHGYYASISYLDAQVGKLLDTLDSLGTLKNTVVILWGDHGWHLGDHDLWNKHTCFENATKVPLIIAAPGMKPGYAETFAEFTDVYPTLCDLSGIQIPSNLDGKSLVLALKDKQSKVHEYAISQYPRKLTAREVKEKGYRSNEIMGYSLRTERYRYTIWLNDFTTNKEFKEKYTYTEELYDYEKDPLETKNVIEQQEYLTTKTQLKQQMIRFFKEQKNR